MAVGQLALQLPETLGFVQPKGIRPDPLLADPATVHNRGHAIPGSLGIGEAAREPPTRLAKF